MSREKLQLLVATCREIPDRLNVRCHSMCAASCLNFKKVPELYGFLGPIQWMWCTRDLSKWGFKCHQFYGTCCAGLSPHVRAYPGCSSGALAQACPFHGYPPPPKRPQSRSVHFPSLLLLAWYSFTGALVHLSSLELSWSDHSLFPSEQGLWMKRSRTVPYTGLGILGTQGHRVRALLTAPALLISEKSPCFKCV